MNCPICKKPVDKSKEDEKSFYPFCSERCKLIDLGRWFGGKYQVPVSGAETLLGQPRDDSTISN